MNINAKLSENSPVIFEPRASYINFICFIIFSIFSLSLLIILLVDPKYGDFSIEFLCRLNFLAFLSIYLFNLFFLRLDILSLPQIFLTVTFMYTSGLLTLHGIGLVDFRFMMKWYDELHAAIAIKMIIMAFFSIEAGICLSLFGNYDNQHAEATINSRFSNSLFKLGIICFTCAISIILLCTLFGSGFSGMFKYGYGGFKQSLQYSDSRLFLTSLSTLLPVSIIIMAAGSMQSQVKYVYICTIVALTAFFLAGDRGGAFTFLLALMFTLNLVAKKLSYTKIIVGALLIIVLIPIIKDLRQRPISEVISGHSELTYEASPFVRAFSETGGSFQTLLGTIMIIPELENYRYGKTYIHALSKIVPNLGTWKTPSGEIVNLTAWITSYMNPGPYSSGLGFLQVAEFYVQFGSFGIFAGFITMGFFLTKWQKKCEQGFSDRRKIAIIGCILCFLLIWIRNDVYSFVRPTVWSILLILTCTSIAKTSSPFTFKLEERKTGVQHLQ